MEEFNEDEVFEKKEKKVKMPKLNKRNGIIIILVLIAILLVILEATTHSISGLANIGKVGNSIGNIINCGYSVENKDYIFYVSPTEDMTKTQISKLKKGTNEPEVIYQGDYDVRALNIVGNTLYFISISSEYTDDFDSIDNKIYRMDLDGKNCILINDNDFAYDYYDLYTVGNNIYYVGTDYNVYKMDLYGGNRSLVAETKTGYLAINNKYIIYNKENQDQDGYVTYIKSLNKNDERQILSTGMNTPIIYNDYIYYINKSYHLSKVPVAGGDETEITDFMLYNMNIYNGNIYYLNYKDEANENYIVSIYKLDLDGGQPELIKDLENYSSFLNVVNDCVYYMDMTEEKAFINLVNVNDLTETLLYEWKL